MKELSIEEKAKAYDEVYKKVAVRFGSNVADEIFLKESEDEEIRKESITIITCAADDSSYIYMSKVDSKRYIAWLEKQGEQKPTDKVEPKFKIEKEKWYVCTQTYVLRGKIVVIKGQTYQAEKDNIIKGEDGCLFIDKHDGKALDYFRSWTIQDAKEGDVLACKGEIKNSNGIKYERICLFNNLDNALFTLTKVSNGVEYYDINVNIDYPDNTVPATKKNKKKFYLWQ